MSLRSSKISLALFLEAAGADIERPPGSASFTMDDADGYIPLEGLIDKEEELGASAERKREADEADQIDRRETRQRKLCQQSARRNCRPGARHSRRLPGSSWKAWKTLSGNCRSDGWRRSQATGVRSQILTQEVAETRRTQSWVAPVACQPGEPQVTEAKK